MTFLSVLIVFILVQWWGSGSPLHYDLWYTRWIRWLQQQNALIQIHPGLVLFLSLLGPAIILLLVLYLVNDIFPWLQLVIAVPILLYSLGRGKYTARVSAYKKARGNDDWEKALESFCSMREHCSNDDCEQFSSSEIEWSRLDHAMLSATAYRGFERMFTVLFWFVAFGPVGALIYRLSSLFLEEQLDGTADESDDVSTKLRLLTKHWLWVLEWPVIRVLSLSFALTGNFVSCMQGLQLYLFDTDLPSAAVLRHFIYGALNLNAEKELQDDNLNLIFKACLSLLSRTLILWICVLAVITLW